MVLKVTSSLPPPITWLSTQPTKLQIKSVAKSAVLQFWLAKIRAQADSLPSLQYIKSRCLGLTRCHPIFRLCGSSPWEVEKATIKARLLSGRVRVESLTRHWVQWNREGLCTLPDWWGGAGFHVGTVFFCSLVPPWPPPGWPWLCTTRPTYPHTLTFGPWCMSLWIWTLCSSGWTAAQCHLWFVQFSWRVRGSYLHFLF